jgi:DNA polymerase-1
MKLLIDCDFVVYKCCAAAETETDFGDDVIVVTSRFSEAYKCVKRDLGRIANKFGSFDEMILFFSDSKNFRKDINESYKGHRNRKKPCGYRRVINKLCDEYSVIKMPKLEADDAMGVYATKHTGNIIVSPDKDMKQIEGMLWNFDETFTITKEEGAKWHLIQTLAGDNTDGYSGVPGIGVKRAAALFDSKGYSWKTVVEAFKEKDLSEEVALENARLARILTNEDYDDEKMEPILWNPSTDYRIDS